VNIASLIIAQDPKGEKKDKKGGDTAETKNEYNQQDKKGGPPEAERR
jgi:hypothetical protein